LVVVDRMLSRDEELGQFAGISVWVNDSLDGD
jgi:hypothetical protein